MGSSAILWSASPFAFSSLPTQVGGILGTSASTLQSGSVNNKQLARASFRFLMSYMPIVSLDGDPVPYSSCIISVECVRP